MELLTTIARFLIDRMLFTPNQSNNFEAIFDKIKDRYRKVLLLSLTAFSSSLLFVTGVIFFLLGMTSNYEQVGVGDARMIWGLVLAVLALGGFALSTSPTQWRDQKVVPPARSNNQALQDAVALAINEFVRDREFQRQQQTRTQRAA